MYLQNLTDGNHTLGRGQTAHVFSYQHLLSIQQRVILSITVVILMLFSVIGNVATFYVAIRREKIRPLFRTCLISLAISDIIDSFFPGMNDLAQFFSKYPGTWQFGPVMCHAIPFLTILGDLVNSLTLVGISLDRYLSVKRILKNSWDPNGKVCLLLAAIVWGLSMAIASPTIVAYKYIQVYFVAEVDHNKSEILSISRGYMCGASKTVNAHFYMSLFCILFLPLVLSFFWFNSVLAREVWIRRKTIKGSKPQSTATGRSWNQSAVIVVPNLSKGLNSQQTSSVESGTNTGSTPKRSNREIRQIKSFCIILLIMVIFLLFKLPNWIFLVLTFYNAYKSKNPILLQFGFGILSMTSTVLNPLLYAFLTQTVQYLIEVYRKTRDFIFSTCVCFMKAMSSVVIETSESSGINENVGAT